MQKNYDHREDLVDHYWGSINYIAGMIRSSEIKAGLILSFYGIILNMLFISLGHKINTFFQDGFLCLLILLWLSFMCVSIFFSVKCFMPRIEDKYEKNIFFFGDVVNAFGTIKEFSKIFYDISHSEEKLFDQLGQQVYINSKIANTKFQYVNKSLLFLSLCVALLIVILLYSIILLNLK